MPRLSITLAAITLAVGPLGAQTYDALSAETREFVNVHGTVIALTHVRLIDGTGAPPSADQTIIIAGGRIRAVGPTRDVAIPSGAVVRDLTGHTVMPALAEGLVGMTPGSTRKLIVPPTLGAGFNPLGNLPAGSMLILDIEYVGPTESTASAEGH